MGYRYPYRPEISWFLYERNQDIVDLPTVKGIPIYGIGPRLKDDVPPVPSARSWKDQWGWFAEVWNEFTVGQCMGPAAMVYAALYGMEAEMVYTPSDFFIRRTGLLYFEIEAVKRYKQQVVNVMQQHLGYTEKQRVEYLAQLDEAIDEATNFVN